MQSAYLYRDLAIKLLRPVPILLSFANFLEKCERCKRDEKKGKILQLFFYPNSGGKSNPQSAFRLFPTLIMDTNNTDVAPQRIQTQGIAQMLRCISHV